MGYRDSKRSKRIEKRPYDAKRVIDWIDANVIRGGGARQFIDDMMTQIKNGADPDEVWRTVVQQEFNAADTTGGFQRTLLNIFGDFKEGRMRNEIEKQLETIITETRSDLQKYKNFDEVVDNIAHAKGFTNSDAIETIVSDRLAPEFKEIREFKTLFGETLEIDDDFLNLSPEDRDNIRETLQMDEIKKIVDKAFLDVDVDELQQLNPSEVPDIIEGAKTLAEANNRVKSDGTGRISKADVDRAQSILDKNENILTLDSPKWVDLGLKPSRKLQRSVETEEELENVYGKGFTQTRLPGAGGALSPLPRRLLPRAPRPHLAGTPERPLGDF